jgi:hypothetical protein
MPRKIHAYILLVWALLVVPLPVRASVHALIRTAKLLDQAASTCAMNKRYLVLYGEMHLQNYKKYHKAKGELGPLDMALAKCHGEQVCTKRAESVGDVKLLLASAHQYCTEDTLNTGLNQMLETDEHNIIPANDEEDTSLPYPEDLKLEKATLSITLGQSSIFFIAFFSWSTCSSWLILLYTV